MKAMILAFEAPGDFAKRTDRAQFKAYMEGWYAYGGGIEQSGKLQSGAAIEAPETATIVKVRDGARIVEDGPYVDSKEQLGGYFVVEVASMDEAVERARNCPAAKNGFVEVRGVPDYGHEE